MAKYRSIYDHFVTEDGHSKKVKSRHNLHKRNQEERFLKSMNFYPIDNTKLQEKIDSAQKKKRDLIKQGKHKEASKIKIPDSYKSGVVKIGDGPLVHTRIYNKKGRIMECSNARFKNDGNVAVRIDMSRNKIREKYSDVAVSHEYSHAVDLLNKVGHTDSPDEYKQKKEELKKTTPEQKRLLKKHQKRTGVKLDEHDRSGNEINADSFAIINTPGENNANRLKKYLNSSRRKEIDRKRDKLKFMKKSINDTTNQLNEQNVKGIIPAISKVAAKGYNIYADNFPKREKKLQKRYNTENQTRVNVASDYAKTIEK